MLYRKQVTFTTSQDWTFPATALPAVRVVSRGGGGGGGGAAAAGAKGGGGGGGERKEQDTNLVPGATYSVLIGSAGPGGYAAAWDGTQFTIVAPGGDGGDTSIVGTEVLARGGKGGATPNSTNGAGLGGRSGAGVGDGAGNGNASLSSTSSPGASGSSSTADAYSAFHGECSGGSGAAPQIRSVYPGAGRGANSVGNGSDATETGCGGGGAWGTSGSTGARTGGTGYRGQIDIIYWDTVP
ncbi:glycine-rich domain-containing protein [Stenotrophomonas sp. Y-13]|uniref:glycine-rich domain-containing protein n=1 Tax=Stenotrophomonas sp. Y-13 TaxID=3384161 RepID=UPI00391706AF